MFGTSNIICRNIHVTNVYKNVEARDQGSTLHDPIYLYFFSAQLCENSWATVKHQFLIRGVKTNACGNVGQTLRIAMNYSFVLEHLTVPLV